VYCVVPVLGFVMVLATARIGARLHSDWLGAAAAVLLVTSPIFLLAGISRAVRLTESDRRATARRHCESASTAAPRQRRCARLEER
jgi:hypothetical protein